MKHQPINARRTYLTKKDFTRWLKRQEAIKNRTAEEKVARANQVDPETMMVWADDGGNVAPTMPVEDEVKPGE